MWRSRASSCAAARAAERLFASCATSWASGSKSPPGVIGRDAPCVRSSRSHCVMWRKGRPTVNRTQSSVMPTMTNVCTTTPRMARRHKAAVRVSIYAVSWTIASAPIIAAPLRKGTAASCRGEPAVVVMNSAFAQPLRNPCTTAFGVGPSRGISPPVATNGMPEALYAATPATVSRCLNISTNFCSWS